MIFYFQRKHVYYIHILFSSEFFVNNKYLDKNACHLDQLATGKRRVMEVFADEVALCVGQDWRMHLLI